MPAPKVAVVCNRLFPNEHTFWALRIHGESEHSLLQFRPGLHCPLAGRQIPLIGLPQTERRIERGYDSPSQ